MSPAERALSRRAADCRARAHRLDETVVQFVAAEDFDAAAGANVSARVLRRQADEMERKLKGDA